MDDAAAPMHVVQAEEDLLADLANEPNWDALGLMPFDKTEKVFAQDLEDHTNMDTIWTLVLEVVEEGDDVRTAGVGLVGRDEALEKLDFVEGSLSVSGSGFDYLESDVAVHPRPEMSIRSSSSEGGTRTLCPWLTKRSRSGPTWRRGGEHVR